MHTTCIRKKVDEVRCKKLKSRFKKIVQNGKKFIHKTHTPTIGISRTGFMHTRSLSVTRGKKERTTKFIDEIRAAVISDARSSMPSLYVDSQRRLLTRSIDNV